MQYLRLLTAMLLPAGLATADVVVMEEIVARVNGDIITSSELERDRRLAEEELTRQGLTGDALQQAIDNLAANRLRDRIDELLLTQRAEDLDLDVDQDVNRQVANYQRQADIADPDEFAQFVVDQTGQSYEDWRDALRDSILLQTVVREEVMRKIQFTREEEEAYYNEHLDDFQRMERVFLREIFVSTDGLRGEELDAANAKAQDLVARAKRGETFAQLAEDNSESQSKDQGGLLPPYTKGVMGAEIEGLVWDQPRGYVTDLIKIPTGWLILKVEEHHREGLATFEEVQSEIENLLFQSRSEPATRAYLTRLRQDAFLQIRDGYVDSGAAPGKDTSWGEPVMLRPQTVTREEVIADPGLKRLLGVFPIPGTLRTGDSSSR